MKRRLLVALLLTQPLAGFAEGGEPSRQPAPLSAEPVRVFLLAGQSNMEGKAKLSLLEYQATQPETAERFAHLRQGDTWVERDDVWIKFGERHGPLAVGYGSPNCIGPELDFGHLLGDHYDEPVVIIKTAWGGKSLYRDFRPPSSGLPAQDQLAQILERERQRHPDRTLDEVRASFGHHYRAMIADVQQTLADLGGLFPELRGRDVQLQGCVWFQGWNDMVNREFSAAYTENLLALIADLRRDLEAPGLPVVVGQLGVGGTSPQDDRREAFKKAQAAVLDAPNLEHVAVVETDQFWDEKAQAVFDKGWREHLEEWERVGSDYPYHYLGSPRTYGDIGRAFAQALLDLDGE